MKALFRTLVALLLVGGGYAMGRTQGASTPNTCSPDDETHASPVPGTVDSTSFLARRAFGRPLGEFTPAVAVLVTPRDDAESPHCHELATVCEGTADYDQMARPVFAMLEALEFDVAEGASESSIRFARMFRRALAELAKEMRPDAPAPTRMAAQYYPPHAGSDRRILEVLFSNAKDPWLDVGTDPGQGASLAGTRLLCSFLYRFPNGEPVVEQMLVVVSEGLHVAFDGGETLAKAMPSLQLGERYAAHYNYMSGDLDAALAWRNDEYVAFQARRARDRTRVTVDRGEAPEAWIARLRSLAGKL